ncbi:putative pectinesterase/pectinesterase inhibitor 44, partial [Frankliniella fusca]
CGPEQGDIVLAPLQVSPVPSGVQGRGPARPAPSAAVQVQVAALAALAAPEKHPRAGPRPPRPSSRPQAPPGRSSRSSTWQDRPLQQRHPWQDVQPAQNGER